MPYKPAKIQFSLFYPSVNAETHDDIVPDVVGPLHELLCENQFHLVDSFMNGPLCEEDDADANADSSSSLSFSDFGIDKRFYGNPNYSVLMQAPVVVTDEALDNVGWMSWTVYFYILQLGQPMIDMAALGNDTHENDGDDGDDDAVEVVNVMTNVMQLALQVSIMEGDFDNKMSLNLLQQKQQPAHASMSGEEVATWSPHGIVFPPSSSSSTTTSTTIPTNSTEFSTVGMYMEQYHAMRYIGATMFLILWSLVYGMDRLARCRRRQRRVIVAVDLEKATKKNELNGGCVSLAWATEDDVGKMLALGRNDMIRSWEKATANHNNNNNHNSAAMVIIPSAGSRRGRQQNNAVRT